MKIRIREILPAAGGDVRVIFDAAPGTAGGTWRSAAPPVVGETYDVEFTLDRVLDLDGNTAVSRRHEPFMEIDDARVILNGVVENLDRERIGTLRLSPDAAVMLDFADPRINPGDWLTVTADLAACDLYAFAL